MSCKWCNNSGILMMVTKTLHGKDFRAEMCECVVDDRKVLIHDVHEAAPELRDCSKGVRESPE